MNEYLASNRELWDGWAELHRAAPFYDVEAFRSGQSTLNPIELELVGDVKGRELLNLQCHFGMDTLSFARLGARVTGVDFSPRAIALAQSLARELASDATFHCANVLELPENWANRFDVGFTSYGVLPWLPDLRSWAREVARVLRPGGEFILVEFHPVHTMLDDDGRTLRHPYFHSPVPRESQERGSYADPDAPFTHASFEWAHSLSDVFRALNEAGLVIEDFQEYDYSPYGCFPFLEEREPGRWKVRGAEVELPLTFSLRAVRRTTPTRVDAVVVR